MPIAIPTFRGALPLLNPRLLPDGSARFAINCDVRRGDLRPLAGPGVGHGLPHLTQLRDIHNLGGQWLAWTSPVSVAPSTVPGDTNGRIYFTGDGYPKATDSILAVIGGSETFPTQTRRLGVPAPADPLSVEITGAAGGEIGRSVSYVYTYVSEWGEESAPSPPTSVFDVMEGQAARLTGFTMPTAPGVVATAFRLYRTSTGNSRSAEFLFVKELPLYSIVFDDNVPDADLEEVIATETWTAPPDNMQGLIGTSSGLFFGFVGNELLVSEPEIAYAYPDGYRLTTESPIVALGYFGQTVAVLTQTRPYGVYGVEPASLSMERLPFEQACVSARSVVCLGDGVIYASPDGLTIISANGIDLITKNIWTREQWAAQGPSCILGFLFNGRYVAFFEGTRFGFALDPARGDIISLELPEGWQVYGGHYSALGDTLSLLIKHGNQYFVHAWEAGAPMTFRWRSKTFAMPLTSLSAGRVSGAFSGGAQASLTVYADGVARSTNILGAPKSFRLPGGFKGREIELEISGTAAVSEVRVGTSMEDVENG